MPCVRLHVSKRSGVHAVATLLLYTCVQITKLISLCVSATQTISDVDSAGFENSRTAGPRDVLHQEVLAQRCVSNGAILESGDPDAHGRSTGMGGSNATGYENYWLG